MDDVRRLPVRLLSFEEMEAHLNDPLTRIKDSRIIEMYDTFGYQFQVLGMDDVILSVAIGPSQEVKALDLYKLQYRNNPRNNPGLYGLLDEDSQQ